MNTTNGDMPAVKWISCDDRLPKESGLYFTKMVVGSMVTKIVEGNLVIFKSNNGGRWCAGDWKRVTHWFDEGDKS